MVDRNAQLVHRMLDLEIEQGQTVPPEHVFLGSTNDIIDSNIHLVLSASGSTTDIDSHQLSGHHNANIFDRNQHNLQQYHMIPTPHFADAAPSYHNSYMIPSSTSRVFPSLLNHGPSARPYIISPRPSIADPPAHRPFSSNYGVVRSVSGGLLEGGSAGGQVYQDTTNNFLSPQPPFHPSIRHNHQPLAIEGVQGLPSKEVAIVEFPRTQEIDDVPVEDSESSDMEIVDNIHEDSESSDMESVDDIHDEEPLALRDRRHVNTRLTEDTISECLRTRTHAAFRLSSSIDQSREIEQENLICVICQAEYEENEKLGCLECGHEYHVDCIKQWLLLKNKCPLCKNPAFSLDNKE